MSIASIARIAETSLMIDYRDDSGNIKRKEIDDMEFCVRDGSAYFISDGRRLFVPLEQVIQVYTN